MGITVPVAQLIAVILQYCVPVDPPIELRIGDKLRLTINDIGSDENGRDWIQADLL